MKKLAMAEPKKVRRFIIPQTTGFAVKSVGTNEFAELQCFYRSRLSKLGANPALGSFDMLGTCCFKDVEAGENSVGEIAHS